jgi:hypothetical protein
MAEDQQDITNNQGHFNQINGGQYITAFFMLTYLN